MKHLKKIIVCLLSVAILCSSQLTYVNAAAASENVVMSEKNVSCSKNGIEVTFTFSYSDGNSASFIGARISNGTGSINSTSSHFENDTRYATAVVTTSSGTITFNAWCDIYGQTGSY